MVYHIDIDNNSYRVTDIRQVIQETPNIKTLYFNDELSAKASPGQFLMIWIPGVDEIPMSLSTIGPTPSASITVKKVGEATEALHNLNPGDMIGVRGPYGKGFTLHKGRVMIVAGGSGMSPLHPLLMRLLKIGSEVTLILGAKSKENLLFLDNLLEVSIDNFEFVPVTEDGSYGSKGLASEAAGERMEDAQFDMVYACGPEMMMFEVYKLSRMHSIPIEICLERYMRCGMGICGSCGIGKYRVCRDGPVFSTSELVEIEDEFGKYRLSPSGRKVNVE